MSDSRAIRPAFFLQFLCACSIAACGMGERAEVDIADEAVPAEDEPLFADRGYASTRRLTTTDRVAQRSAEPGFVIVDLRSAEAYA